MKKIFLMAFVACATTVALHATAISECNALGGSSFASLENAGSCTIGDKIYSNFSLTGNALNGATALSAANVTFTTINNGNIANGFQFTFILNAFSGESNDIALGYDVAINSGSNLITSEHLGMAGSTTGTGVAVIGETICLGASVVNCGNGNSLGLGTFASGSGVSLTDSKTFAGVSLLGVSKDINVSGGKDGFASISLVSETVDQSGVPEPMTLSLMGAGLLGIGLLGRRLRKK